MYWRNQLIQKLARLLHQRVHAPPFMSLPNEAILNWHLARGPKGKLKDQDEDLDGNLVDDLDHVRPNSSLNTKQAASLNMNMATQSYLYHCDMELSRKRKLSISFDESNLGRENTLTAIVDSYEAGLTAWLLPQVTPPTLHIMSFMCP